MPDDVRTERDASLPPPMELSPPRGVGEWMSTGLLAVAALAIWVVYGSAAWVSVRWLLSWLW